MQFHIVIHLALCRANAAYSGYTQFDGIPGTVVGGCQSSLTVSQVISYTALNSNSTWIMTESTVSSATNIGAIDLRGWNVATATSTTSLPTSTSSSATNTTTGTSKATGLSTGAKLGIGIGVALGTVGLCSLLLTVFLFRRRKRAHSATLKDQPVPVDIGSNPMQELRVRAIPVELEGHQVRD
jgi:hypothetical protein